MPSDIDRLRAAARRLKKAHAAGDADARRRAAAVIAETRPLRHADFLHVIARENGHESWPKLKFALDAAAMTREERAARLSTALFHGQHWVVRKLLADEPDLKDHDLGLQVALYDLAAVKAALARDPAAATRRIGERTPLLHLAFSRHIHAAPERRADMLAIAELLAAHGADPNEGFPPEPGSDHSLSALYGALGHADNMALAEWLLERGASPDDNESLYHATELGHHQGLKLLIAHGVSTRGTNALPRALDFDDLEAVRLLLEHGADPNEAVTDHPGGQPVDTIAALHQAARRLRSGAFARLLLDHGADPQAVWGGHTAYAMARIYGNADFAAELERRGCATPLSPAEAALAACAEGRVPAGGIDPQALGREGRLLVVRLAGEPSRLDHVRALIAAGIDPDQRDEMHLTPLHAAGWAGLPDHVAFLLSRGPDLAHRNRFGGDALQTVVHGAEHNPDRRERDHISCARLLLEAGAEARKELIDGTGSEEMAAFLEDWRGRG